MTPDQRRDVDALVRRCRRDPDVSRWGWLLSLAMVAAAALTVCGDVARAERATVPPTIAPLSDSGGLAPVVVTTSSAPPESALTPSPGLVVPRWPYGVRVPAAAAAEPLVSERDRRLIDAAMYECANSKAGTADPFELRLMLEVESRADVPDDMRGISLAIACVESGYTADAVGDHGLAHGWAQIHDGLWRWCGRPSRADAEGALRCYLRRVAEIARTKTRHCGARAWVTAEAAVARGRVGWCGETTSHVRLLRRWTEAR